MMLKYDTNNQGSMLYVIQLNWSPFVNVNHYVTKGCKGRLLLWMYIIIKSMGQSYYAGIQIQNARMESE